MIFRRAIYTTMILGVLVGCEMQMPENTMSTRGGEAGQESARGGMGQGQGPQGMNMGGMQNGQGRGPSQQQYGEAVNRSFGGRMNVYENDNNFQLSDSYPPPREDEHQGQGDFYQQDQGGNHYRLPPRPSGEPPQQQQCPYADRESDGPTVGVAVDGTPIQGGHCNQDRRYNFSMDIEQESRHRPGTMLGLLADGTPVYGPVPPDRPQPQLDEYGGHFGPTLDFYEGVYHIHLQLDGRPCNSTRSTYR